MVTEVSSKTELAALATKLSTQATELTASVDALVSAIGSASDYDGINVTGAANILKSNLETILADLEVVSANILAYSNELNNLDTNDMELQDAMDEATLNDDASLTTGTTGGNTGATDNSSTNNTNNSTTNNSSTGNNSSAGNAAAIGTVGSVGAAIIGSSGNKTSGGGGGQTSGGGNSSSGGGGGKTSSNTGDSSSNAPSTVKPSGTSSSSNGRTQRSAKQEIKITQGSKNIDVSRYHSNPEKGFNVTTGNLAYELCEEDFELLCAIVSAESDKSYDDALAVITTVLNRCETSNWISSHGRDPISQATAPNQFVVYQHGSYERFMNGNAPATVVQAVKDALAGVRNHKYCSFRSNGTTSYSNNMITSTGNRYK